MTKNPYIYSILLTLKYINRYPIYWLWFFLRIVYVCLTLISPILFGKIIDLLGKVKFDSLNSAPDNLCLFLIFYVVLVFLEPGLEVFTVARVLKISNKISRDFRNDAIGLFENANINFFGYKNKGSFVKIIDSAYSNIYRISEDITHRYLTSVAQVIGIFFITTILSPALLLVFIISVILFLVNLIYFGKKEKEAGIEFSKQEEKTSGAFYEFFNNFKTVFYLDIFKKIYSSIFLKTEDSYSKRFNVVRYSLRKWYNHGQLYQITNVFIFLFGIFQVVKGNFTVGMLVVVISFADRLASQTGEILAHAEIFVERTSSLQRYRDEIEVKLTCEKCQKTGLLSGNFLCLEGKEISLIREEKEGVKNISFNIKNGENIAIIGYTGSGKSTLMDIILKAETGYLGDLIINGVNYRDLSTKDIVNIFSIVPQDVQLFLGTVRDNIILGSSDLSEFELQHLLDVCCLNDFVNKLPNKFDEIIAEGSVNISGGEKQRIGIARALAKGQPVLILDEATASLDPETEKRVIENIINNFPDLLIIYITHKYSVINHFDKIFVLQNGEIVESGSFNYLRYNSVVFKKLFEASKISENKKIK